MDEATVVAALASLTEPDGSPLVTPDDVAGVVTEDGWLCILLRKEGMNSTELLAPVYARLAEAFPGIEVEVRVDRRIYRGGQGFGDGRHVVVVLGGKGGVGKSTVSVNLALTLWALGIPVGLLDGDLNAPDIPHMLGVHPKEQPPEPPRPRRLASGGQSRQYRVGVDIVGPGGSWSLPSAPVPPSKRKPLYGRHNLEIMSVGFVAPERRPMALTGRGLVSSMLRNLIFDMAWTADVLLIDAPPGTGDEIQVMARELPLSGAIFVTTPQDLAQMDAERTFTLLREQGIMVIGMVQNMSSLTCPHCDKEIDLFGQSSRLADAGVQVLGRIPFDTRLSVNADQGLPLVLGDPTGPISYAFARIGSRVRAWLRERGGLRAEQRPR
jgi:ATP-binding protein involved in chromosome partitioning